MFFKIKSRRFLIYTKRRNYPYKQYLLTTVMILIGFAGLIYFLLSSNYLSVNSLEMRISNISCASKEDIKNNIYVEGRSIVLLDPKEITLGLKAKFECVKNVNIQKKYPQKLLIEISGSTPVLVLQSVKQQDASGEASLVDLLEQIASPSASASDSAKINSNLAYDSYKIDIDGKVIIIGEDPDLPSVKIWDLDISVGKALGVEFVGKVLRTVEKLKSLNVYFSEIRLYRYTLLIKSDKIIVLDFNSEIDRQLASLQLILEKAKIENENVVYIDLRFDKPVVRYAKKKN